jgi:hypothetical protein
MSWVVSILRLETGQGRTVGQARLVEDVLDPLFDAFGPHVSLLPRW